MSVLHDMLHTAFVGTANSKFLPPVDVTLSEVSLLFLE